MKNYVRTTTLKCLKSIDNPKGEQRIPARRQGYKFSAVVHDTMPEYLVEADGTLHLKRFCEEFS